MSPTIEPGTFVDVRPGRRPRAGDAVLFRSEHTDVLHRFLFKLPLLPYFVHRGDAADATVGISRWEGIQGVAELPPRALDMRECIEGCFLVAKRVPVAVIARLRGRR